MKDISIVQKELTNIQEYWETVADSPERKTAKKQAVFLRGVISVLKSGVSEAMLKKDKEIALKKRRMITDLVHKVKVEQVYGDAKIQKKICSDLKKEHGDKNIALQLKTIKYILED